LRSNPSYYYYCVTHKKSILPEDYDRHTTDECQYTKEEFKYKKHGQIKKFWAAKSVAKKHGMQIYTPPKKEKVVIDTLPSDAILIDTASPRGKQLD